MNSRPLVHESRTITTIPRLVLPNNKNILHWAIPGPIYIYFRSFQASLQLNKVDFSGIRTRITGVEGEHADHQTTTTAPNNNKKVCVRFDFNQRRQVFGATCAVAAAAASATTLCSTRLIVILPKKKDFV